MQPVYQPEPVYSSPPPGYRQASNPDDPIQKLRAFASKVEDNIEIYSQPFKPHMPAIGRFLIVVTFLEDSLRIVSQWGDQLWYLQRFVLLPSPWLFWYSHDCIRFCLDTGTSPGESHISSLC